MEKRKIVEGYIEGWKSGAEDKVTACLTPDCVIIESDNSSYRGAGAVSQWVNGWKQKGNKVDRWEIELYWESGDAAFFEWHFECTIEGAPRVFDGASFVKFGPDKISYLREYRTVRREVEQV